MGEQISLDGKRIAARMAAEWWGERLDGQHSDKKAAFVECLRELIEEEFKGAIQVYLRCDYDPSDILLKAVRLTVDPKCSGFMFSAKGIFPEKHSLLVTPFLLTPKEGYGNFTDPIQVEIK